MAYQTLQQEYLQIPVVTRAYTTACVLTTAAVVREGALVWLLLPGSSGCCPDRFSRGAAARGGGTCPYPGTFLSASQPLSGGSFHAMLAQSALVGTKGSACVSTRGFARTAGPPLTLPSPLCLPTAA